MGPVSPTCLNLWFSEVFSIKNFNFYKYKLKPSIFTSIATTLVLGVVKILVTGQRKLIEILLFYLHEDFKIELIIVKFP